MIKLEYHSKNDRWHNDLIFGTWEEYWKTLGYLSNPNVHRANCSVADIKIVLENNQQTASYSAAYRIEFFGNKNRFKQEFPALDSVARSKGDMYRINRNEFGETLVQDLDFIITDVGGRNTDIVLPPTNIDLLLNSLRQNPDFNEVAWNEGYNLGNL